MKAWLALFVGLVAVAASSHAATPKGKTAATATTTAAGGETTWCYDGGAPTLRSMVAARFGMHEVVALPSRVVAWATETLPTLTVPNVWDAVRDALQTVATFVPRWGQWALTKGPHQTTAYVVRLIADVDVTFAAATPFSVSGPPGIGLHTNHSAKQRSHTVTLRPFVDHPPCYSLSVSNAKATVKAAPSAFRVLLWFVGLAVIFAGKPLSGSIAFYYSASTMLGMLVIGIAALYFVSSFLGRRVPTWVSSVGLLGAFYGFVDLEMDRLIAPLLDPKVLTSEAFLWSVLAGAVVSFGVTYWRGPPSTRTVDVLGVSVQLVGVLLQALALQDKGVAAVLGLALVLYTRLPSDSVVYKLVFLPLWVALWFVSFVLRVLLRLTGLGLLFSAIWRGSPAPPKLISLDDFEAQGRENTAQALRQLRDVLATSPERARILHSLHSETRRSMHAFLAGEEHVSELELQAWQETDAPLPHDASDGDGSDYYDDDDDYSGRQRSSHHHRRPARDTHIRQRHHTAPTFADIKRFSDLELRQTLQQYGYTPGPVVPSTRPLLERKLMDLSQRR
eukprot:m.492126 g.492126  ORF g.492126 m.492126 type:complete len:562 (+) comp31655_c0_seq1:209-1894(+)